MEFNILGPLEVRGTDGSIPLGGAKPRAVLAVLLLNPNEPVSAERLALALWGEDAPAGSVKTVQVHVSRLRKSLGDGDAVTRTAAGYRLRVRRGERDVERFDELVARGRRELAGGRPEAAADLLREALGLWRGTPLGDLADAPFASGDDRAASRRLGSPRWHAASRPTSPPGGTPRSIGELRGLVAEHPTHEGFAAQLMLALYRCGRQAEALDAFQDARERLVGELGVEPGPELRELQEAILRHDPKLTPAACRAARRARGGRAAGDPRPHGRAGLAARALGARRERPRRARADHRPARDRADADRRRAGGGGPPARRRRALRLRRRPRTEPCGGRSTVPRVAERPLLLVLDDARRGRTPTRSSRLDALAGVLPRLPVLDPRRRREHRGTGRRAPRRLDRARPDRRRGGPRDRGGATSPAPTPTRSPPSCSGPPPRASRRASSGSPPSGRATRRSGASVRSPGEAAAGRARLRSMEDELAGGVALLRRSARGPAGRAAAW